MAILNLVSHKTSFDFIKYRKISFLTVIITTLIVMGSIFFKGLNYGIDFKGGILIELRVPTVPDLHKMRSQLMGLHVGDVSIQEFGSKKDLLIRVEQQNNQEHVIKKIKAVLPKKSECRKIETIGPKVGTEMMKNGFYAVVYSLVAIMIYIACRFEWRFAVCAVVALAHDCFLILGLFSLFPLEFNETAITAILITASYSINDTIVVFDRIRENIGRYRKMALTDILNVSINETLSRTILTVFTTFLSTLALYVFGGEVIASFVLPIMIALVVGTISSIFVAAPLLLLFNVKHGEALATSQKEIANAP